MIYTIVFVEKALLRDIKLTKIFDEDDSEGTDVYDGPYSYTGKVVSSRLEVWDNIHHEKAILGCTKWKTTRGAQNAIKRIEGKIKSARTRGYYSYGKSNAWATNEWTPLVYDITSEWNKIILAKMDLETKNYKKRIESLSKKLG